MTRLLSFYLAFSGYVTRRLWLLAYSLEDSRERYASKRQLLRQAAACVLLAMIGGGSKHD